MTPKRWLPTEAQILAHIEQQRADRIRMAQRVDDGPQTILMPQRPMTQKGEFMDSFPVDETPEAESNHRFWRGLLIASAVSSALWLAVLIGWVARGHA